MPLVVVGKSRKVHGQSPQSEVVASRLVLRAHGEVDIPQKLARTQNPALSGVKSNHP